MAAEHGVGEISAETSSLEDDKRLGSCCYVPDHVGPVHVPVCAVGPVWEADAVYLTMWDLSMFPCVLWDLSAVWEADAVYLTMWDLSMLLCVLWDLSAILCSCPHSWRSYITDAVYLTMWDLSMFLCVLWDLSAILCTCPGGPVCVPEDVPVFLRDLSPATRQENIGLDPQSVIRTPHVDP
ncbi:hypothetical protein Bbelb_261080 [Branchiostoma belcheri]|nr:hypothetical protein Bbelb_261080 [Branchiostoma belcheri]